MVYGDEAGPGTGGSYMVRLNECAISISIIRFRGSACVLIRLATASKSASAPVVAPVNRFRVGDRAATPTSNGAERNGNVRVGFQRCDLDCGIVPAGLRSEIDEEWCSWITNTRQSWRIKTNNTLNSTKTANYSRIIQFVKLVESGAIATLTGQRSRAWVLSL